MSRLFKALSQHELPWPARLAGGAGPITSIQRLLYTCGLNGDFSGPELIGWHHFAEELRDAFCATFPCTPVDFGPLPGFSVGNLQVIVAHPLWDSSKPIGELATAIATVGADSQLNLRFLDTFNMQRRMSWTYQALRG